MSDNTQPTPPAATAESNGDRIKLMTIQNLLGKKFFIPKYQRGYRWTPRQVEDLLDDIWEFMEKPPKANEFYCLQPLVVQNTSENKNDKGPWEVIDGQQRLTTIKIILAYLDQKLPQEDKGDLESEIYSLEYETRKKDEQSENEIKKFIGSKEFLDNIASPDKLELPQGKKIADIVNSNIDFFHMRQAYATIEEWFNPNNRQNRLRDFRNTLLKDVQIIWYDAKDEDPIEVFTRLNIGKISLTNAELIKALFLKRSNWSGKNSDSLSLTQLEIASQWDNIEYTLQNDEFWMFFHSEDAPPTRIDYIFDYICNKNLLYDSPENDHNSAEEIGSDSYRTFRYFYNYFYPKDNVDRTGQNTPYNKTKTCWNKVKEIFGTLLEWYNDCKLYHYIGFLLAEESSNAKMYELLSAWLDKEIISGDQQEDKAYYAVFLGGRNLTRSKETFCNWLKYRITKNIRDKECCDLDKPYEIEDTDAKKAKTAKSNCRPLLLLFNVQTVINQNKGYLENQQYKLGVFYKFPFHLYKREKWDIEHIDSHTNNDLTKETDRKEWLYNKLYEYKSSGRAEMLDTDVAGQCLEFLKKNQNNEEAWVKIRNAFDELESNSKTNQSKSLLDDEKDKVWNFALLSQKINRSYHNDVFPTKRRKLIAKEQGKVLEWQFEDENDWTTLNLVSQDATDPKDPVSAFVPPCTRNAFMKYYTPENTDIWIWNHDDAEKYKSVIADTLNKFINGNASTGDQQGE